MRRGLPRVKGGPPWPAAADAPASAVPAGAIEGAAAPVAAAGEAAVEVAAVVEMVPAAPEQVPALPEPVPAVAEQASTRMRRGLPRVAGGDPWPPASAPVAPVVEAAPAVVSAPAEPAPPASAVAAAASAAASASVAAPAAPASVAAPVAAAQPASAPSGAPAAASVRRGLPRVAGGDPWPPADTVPSNVELPQSAASVADTPQSEATQRSAQQAPTQAPAPAPAPTQTAARDVSVPLPFTRTVWPGAAAAARPAPRPEPARIRGLTKAQWAGAVIVGGAGLLFAAFMVVVLTRWLVSLEPLQDFLTTYPGESHLPDGAPVGLPAWLGWQHFFNVFLMVLIIRSGLQVRTEKRPSMFWSPRWNPKRKISISLWLHQSLDILWIVNGIVFIVLLFVTGQWMRVVPTSWDVIPNALSAAIQYVSLDWPTENGWVNYNSLQVLAYFTTIFIAAPLAVITGVRMSGIWPPNARTLNRLYPVEVARAIHFPVMLYFVAFIIVHVALVFATGALRNLNHMYAAQGSVDPTAYAANWTGFWIFFASLVVIVAGWIAARPLVLAGIARAFGKVSGR